jgi:hypothetical protein
MKSPMGMATNLRYRHALVARGTAAGDDAGQRQGHPDEDRQVADGRRLGRTERRHQCDGDPDRDRGRARHEEGGGSWSVFFGKHVLVIERLARRCQLLCLSAFAIDSGA